MTDGIRRQSPRGEPRETNSEIKLPGEDSLVSDELLLDIQKSEERLRTVFRSCPEAISISRLHSGLYVDVNDGFCELTGYSRQEVLGKTSLELGIWADEKDRGPLVHRLASDGVVRDFEAEFRVRNGHPVTGLVSARLILLESEPCILSLTKDITHLKENTKKLDSHRGELEQAVRLRTRELHLLHQINSAANMGRPLPEILQMTTDGVSEVFKYDACDIYMLDVDNNELVNIALTVDSRGLRAAEKLTGLTGRGIRVSLADGGIFSEVVRSGKAVLSHDMTRVFEDFSDNPLLRRFAGQVARLFGYRAAIRAPLMVGGKVIGAMGVARKSPVTESDAEVLERFASQVALTIGKASSEKALLEAYEGLEEKVRQRTAELDRINRELLAEIGERRKAEEALGRSLAEKDLLLREMNHRIKNNLAMLMGLLKIQAREVEDEKARGLFDQSTSRVMTMSLLHDKLTFANNPNVIKLSPYVRSLAEEILKASDINEDRVVLSVEASDVTMDVDTAIPCGLIINELLTNCLKYAFPGGRSGNVWVSFTKSPARQYRLEVRDDGVGLPEAGDSPLRKSLGMELVGMLAGQLNGRLEVENGGGSCFRITFDEKN